MPKSKNPSPRLFIGGLPYRFTEGELLSLFAPFGRIVFLKIMHTPWGKSRGIGFVEFDSVDSAATAKLKLHNHHLDVDRTIIVDFAEPDPMSTDEGRQRHQEAVIRNPKKFKNFADAPAARGSRHPPRPAASRPINKFQPKPKFGDTRQSTYDSRHHHAKVGKKFASRRKFKPST